MKKYIMWIASFLVLLGADQFTKYLAVSFLKGNDGISIINKVFKLFYLENHGAAFGILQDKRIFLLIITLLILAAIIFAIIKIPSDRRFAPVRWILIVLAAGAVGNMIDRVVNGYVVDFLYFELIDFPVFNVADCYVVVSAILAILLVVFFYKDEDFENLSEKKDID